MNAADIIKDVELLHLDRRETQFVRAELIEKIDAAIAAAVAAETERCAAMGDQLAKYFDQHPGIKDKAAAESCRQYAASIRAGNGSR